MSLTARFVDTIASAPTVRLNVNDGATWRLLAASRFDPPGTKRARVSTLLTDGATYPADAYDDRVLDLQLQVNAATADAAATQVQALARELDRESNIFQYQLPDMTHPVFFRTHRLGFDSLDIVSDGTLVNLRASVAAEPFAYGVPETLSSATVNFDPAAGSNGQFFDISGVLGDVETPLVLRFDHADTVESAGMQSVIGIRRWGTVSSVPFLLQAESMTQGTNTTTQPNDATMSGSSNNFSRCTFTSASMATRLSTSAHPSVGGANPRGRYRLLMRYRKSVSGDSINVRAQWGDSNVPITNSTVTLPSGTGRRYVDLGDVQIPVGIDNPQLISGAQRSVLGIYLAVQAERVSGSGNLDMDFLVLVPADDRLLAVIWYPFTGPSFSWLDGVADQAYCTNASDSTSARGPIIPLGGMPMVSPGATNRIFIVSDVHPSAANDDIGNSFTIVPSYLPRYLFVRPPSS